MRRAQIVAAVACCAAGLQAASFSGTQALEYTRAIVLFGPRPPGSPAIRKTRQFITRELRNLGCTPAEETFEAQTPHGPVRMVNLVVRIPGNSGRAVVISGHYDTKKMPGIRFVGANDGGASAGFLLEMARVLCNAPRRDDVYLVWFDGEEALVEWSETDGLYGSRHLVRRWGADGTLARLKALINVDMIGVRDLQLVQEYHSTPWLREMVWRAAHQLGYGRYYTSLTAAIEDDHVPFLRAGVPALDLIHNYGGPGSTWHTAQDTIDRLDASSFEAVGAVLLHVISQLESRR